jgi:hypothetical protein
MTDNAQPRQPSVGPSDVLGREIAITLVREALDKRRNMDNDGRAVTAILALDKAMREASE